MQVHTLILCATLGATQLTLFSLSPSPRGGDIVQEVRSDTWKMAPARS